MNRIALLAALALAACSGSSDTTGTTTAPVLSDDTTLSALTVSAGALSPAFAPATHQYTLTVPYGTGLVRVTPTANDSHALSVAVRQDTAALYTVQSGRASAALTVPAVGATSKLTVRVTAQDGSDDDYLITMTQSAKLSSDATLSALTPSAGTLAPAFDPAVYTYLLSVPNGTTSLSVTATQHDASATSLTVKQDNAAVTGALAIPAVGAESHVAVHVVAQDGTVADYTVTLTQAPAVAPASFTIYAIGDSTMADYPSTQTPPQNGWGQMFRNFLVGTDVAYVNAAHNGRSSRSFYDEGSWAPVRAALKSGDYVFIQWAHNDEKDNGLDGAETPVVVGTSIATYKTYLQKYVDETKAAGAIPVFFTPVVRRYFDTSTPPMITPKGAHDLTGTADASLTGQSVNYVQAMKDIATANNVQLVDLTASTKALVEQYGPTDAKSIIYIAADDTHLQPLGATLFAQLAVQGLIAQNILTQYLNPAGDLIVSPNALDFGQVYTSNTKDLKISVTGLSLSPDAGNVTVTAPSGWLVSSSATGTFTSSVQLAYTGGKLAPASVYVRFAPSAGQPYSGDVTVAPPSGNTVTVALTGTGLVPSTGGTESTAVYSLTADFTCAATGLATCTDQTYSNMELKGFTTPNTTDTATWIPSAPANHTVEKAQIAGGTWPGAESDINPTRYVQFAVAPAAGKNWAIDAISLWSGAAGGSNLGYKIYYSKAADFSNPTLLLDSSANAKDTMVFQQMQPVVTVNSGQTLYVRVFPWLSGSATATGKYLCLQSLTIHGSAQ